MPWFDEFLKALWPSSDSVHPIGRRAVAAALAAALLLANVGPGVAMAGEIDSESEGTATPGAIEPAPDLNSEEVVLEEVSGAASGGSEEAGEGLPLETESAQESEPPPIAAEEAETTTPETESLPADEAASAESGAPEYEPAPPSASSAPIENQAISAPESRSSAELSQDPQGNARQTPVAEPPSSAPVETPEPKPTQPASPPQPAEVARSLAGRHSYVVRPGDCLWSIAARLLPVGAGTTEIEMKVARLWKLNAARIGTGDPSLLYVGTELRLR